MALRAIEPFQNMSHAYSATILGYTTALSAYNVPFILYGGDTNGYGRVTSLELQSDGWLLLSSIGSVSGQRQVGVGRTFANMGITITANTVLFGGVRMKFGRTVPNQLITTQYTAAQAILSAAQVPGGVTLGQEYYFEWCIDMVNNVIRARVDGVEIVPVALNGAVRNALLAGTNILMYGTWISGSAAANDIYIKDGYILEATPDGLMSSWLGPQVVRKLPVADATGPWTATGDVALKDALNTPITSVATRLTPVISNDPDATELGVKFDTSSIKGKLSGVAFNVSMIKQPGKPGSVESSVVSGGTEGPKSTSIATQEMLMYQGLSVSSKSPNGNAWTAESLAAATLKLKPVS